MDSVHTSDEESCSKATGMSEGCVGGYVLRRESYREHSQILATGERRGIFLGDNRMVHYPYGSLFVYNARRNTAYQLTDAIGFPVRVVSNFPSRRGALKFFLS